jgi:hypothetical protein
LIRFVGAILALLAAGTVPSSDVRVHVIESEYQPGSNEILVLLPDRVEPGRKYPVLYVLPVYAGPKPPSTAIDEVGRLNLHNTLGVICVSPAFAQMPWYADHATDRLVRQESHFVKTVVPFVEEHYPAMREPRGRLLVGFSKSGWGAITLLLRHPDFFGRAASFDAPLMMDTIGEHSTDKSMGTQPNFDAYCVTRLLEQRAGQLRNGPARLVILGRGKFDDDRPLHELMQRLDVPHHWDRGDAERPHKWDGGWLAPAAALLVRQDLPSSPPATRPER